MMKESPESSTEQSLRPHRGAATSSQGKLERGGRGGVTQTLSGLSVEGRPRGGGDPMVHAVVRQECMMMAAR